MNNATTHRIELLLKEASEKGASDLHLIPGEMPAMRINGKIERTTDSPLTVQEIVEFAETVVGKDEMNRIGTEVGEIHRSFEISERHGALVCVARSLGNYTVAIRLFLSFIPSVKDVALPQALLQASESGSGLIVFSGQTGSGKSTTAYSLIEHINATRSVHICTVEDPVIYRFKPKRSLIQQRELGTDTPNTVAGIRAASEQDADVLFVSELKSLEDLQACIASAENGHLVITVAHANAPEDAIQRMIDVFPEDMHNVISKALANTLRGVSSQILLPRSDRPGRAAAYGVIIPDDEMRQAIAEGRDFLVRKKPLPEGCRTLAEDIERLKREGIISEETADKVLSEI